MAKSLSGCDREPANEILRPSPEILALLDTRDADARTDVPRVKLPSAAPATPRLKDTVWV